MTEDRLYLSLVEQHLTPEPENIMTTYEKALALITHGKDHKIRLSETTSRAIKTVIRQKSNPFAVIESIEKDKASRFTVQREFSLLVKGG